MKVLVACEESQAVTKELRKLGHEAYSCDIIPCSGGHDEWHIMQDVLPLLNGNCEFSTCDNEKHCIEGKWDMIIAFPPCTHLAVSGAPHFEKKREDGRQRFGVEFFVQFLNADCDRIAIENPVGIISGGDYIQKHFPDLAEKYGLPREYSQKIHPWMFGDNFSKQTCLWLKGLPNLIPITEEEPEMEYKEWIDKKTGKKKRQNLWYYNALVNSKTAEERACLRSKTFPGIARAMAEQWAGSLDHDENMVETVEKEKKEMELKVENYQLPESISFNFEELKAELEARVHMYEVMFYADDQIKEAKADRASLNKLKKALNDERIRMEKEYMVPFNEFKARINEIIGIIDRPIEMIDKQVKAYEDKQKQDKLDAIITFFNEQNRSEWLHFSQIFDERWLNASVSMKSVQDAISAELVRITTDLATLADLPEFGFEATEVYKSTLDINKAISEGHRLLEIAKKKAEFESTQAAKLAEQMAEVEVAKVVEEVLPEIEPVRTWIAFEANMTIDDAVALREFFNSRHIEFRALYA